MDIIGYLKHQGKRFYPLTHTKAVYDNNGIVLEERLKQIDKNSKLYTDTKVADLVGSAPETLDTIEEVANAIQNNADVVQALNSAIGEKANKTDIDLALSDKLDSDGNASDATVTFTETSIRDNVGSGESFATLFGKIKKWFADLKTVAFTGNYQDLDNTPTNATASTDGLMSSDDKTKLDGISTGANNYIHPSTHPASVITQDSTHRFVTDSEKNIWNSKANANHTHTIDSALSSTSANPVQNKAVTAAINDTNDKIDGFLNTTDYLSISEIAEAINNKLDKNFNSGGFVSLDEITETLNDCNRSATIVIGASNSRYGSEHMFAADYYCTGANDQTIINSAIAALPSGSGKVILLDGTYNISGSINISSKNNITIEGMGKSTIIKPVSSSAALTCINISGGQGLTLKDFVVDMELNTSQSSCGIKIYSVSKSKITGIEIKNFVGNGFEVYGVNDAEISYCTIHDGRNCFWDRGNNHVLRVIGNVIDTMSNNGWEVYNSSTLNIYENNVFRNCEDGIRNNAAYNIFIGNSIYNCSRYGIYSSGAVCTVSDNNIRSSGTSGIYINGKNTLVSGNTAIRADSNGNVQSYSSAQHTIELGTGATYCLVSGNVILGKNYTNNGGTTNTFANNKYE